MYKITSYSKETKEERKVIGGLSYLEAQGFLKVLFTELAKATSLFTAYARLGDDYAVIRLIDGESCYYYEIENEDAA